MSFTSMWAALSPIGRGGDGGYRRFAWTREDHTLREWFAGECAARGLSVLEDRAGNQWAWWGDPDAAVRAGRPGVVAGSHLDSVPDGGAFDGPLGVVSALAAVEVLQEKGFRPSRPIGVVNFVDEEGARFGIACAGSRVITGALPAERALGLRDGDGLTMAEAWAAAGRDPLTMGPDGETLTRVGMFVELHVEQGRALVDHGAPVGVATDIRPHGRWRLELPGQANHAGTTALEDRHDAMLSLARATLGARNAAAATECVATIGKARITPGGVNAIASHVTAWLDARGPSEEQVRRTVAMVTEGVRRDNGEVAEESWTPTTSFDPSLMNRIATRLGGIPALGTGAGHDAGILATHGIPAAMLFVRNPTGVSHSPAEWADEADCHAGVAALAAVLEDLAGDAA